MEKNENKRLGSDNHNFGQPLDKIFDAHELIHCKHKGKNKKQITLQAPIKKKKKIYP